MQEKALEEDPTVYQYDEIYEEIDQKKKESKLARKDIDKKPKYINKLLAAADRRKRENEKRIEKQVQKEREAEGDEFKDKESFVTTAYRKKLEEMKALEEAEQREDYLESIGDVKKQGNLDGFYRHLYEQKVNYDEVKKDDTKEIEIKKEPEDNQEISNDTEAKAPKQQRKYRKRNHNSDDNESETEDTNADKKLEHLPSNLDADSDFSIDSSDSEDEAAEKPPKKKNKSNDEPETNEVRTENANDAVDKKDDANKTDDIKKEVETKAEEVIPVVKKPKIDIWKKRTVGDIFDAALQRYFERKALRESG